MVGKEGDLSFQVQNLPDGRDGGSVYAPVSSPKELQDRLFKAGQEATGVVYPSTTTSQPVSGKEFAFNTGEAMQGVTDKVGNGKVGR